MQTTFREITEADAEALAKLSLQFGYTVSVAEMQVRIRQVLAQKDHFGIVACTNEQVTGWIHAFYTFRLESEPFAEIGGMVVDQNVRRQGIGRQLLEKVKEWAAAKSVERVRVRCNTTRLDAHAFYLRAGFAESKEQKVFDLSVGLRKSPLI